MTANPAEAGVLVRLPEELHYLIQPVLRCGCRTEWEAWAYLDSATDEQRSDLASIAERIQRGGHYAAVNRFLDVYDITDKEECAKLYFFFGLLDAAGLRFD